MRNSWMPEVFNDFFDTDFMPRTNATAPAINVKETEHEYTVELAAPGMKKDDFNINIDNDGNLHIKMEQKNEKKDDNSSRTKQPQFFTDDRKDHIILCLRKKAKLLHALSKSLSPDTP